MGLLELLLIAVGLSMDAFAVSVTNGLCYKNVKLKWTLAMGLCFGLFQGAMPTIGYFLGSTFADYISALDHYIALILLCFIGGKMLYDVVKSKEEDIQTTGASEDIQTTGASIGLGILLVQGVATSIDALAVGVSFAMLPDVDIVTAAGFIALVTFMLSVAAVFVGKKFGSLLNNKAQIIGGLILIAIGLKIFIEHTFFGG